jgi:UDP-N-acetylglucosamine acyltransferase
MLAEGCTAEVRGLNVVGLRRGGFTQDQRTGIKEAYKAIYSGRNRKEVLAELESKFKDNEIVMRLVRFVRNSKRGIAGGHGGGGE